MAQFLWRLVFKMTQQLTQLCLVMYFNPFVGFDEVTQAVKVKPQQLEPQPTTINNQEQQQQQIHNVGQKIANTQESQLGHFQKKTLPSECHSAFGSLPPGSKGMCFFLKR